MWNFLFLRQISSSAQSIWLCGVAYFEHICLSALFIWLSGVADFPQICFSTLNIWIFDYLAVLISQTDLVICTKYTIVRSCLFLQQIWLAAYDYLVLFISNGLSAHGIWLFPVAYHPQIYSSLQVFDNVELFMLPADLIICIQCLIIWSCLFQADWIIFTNNLIIFSCLSLMDFLICIEYVIIWGCSFPTNWIIWTKILIIWSFLWIISTKCLIMWSYLGLPTRIWLFRVAFLWHIWQYA